LADEKARVLPSEGEHVALTGALASANAMGALQT
jgi:hypothetical protein